MGKTLEGPGSFVAVQCDVSREDDVMRLFKVINDEHKGVDVCINNAGVNHGSSLLNGDTKQWAEMLNVRVDQHIGAETKRPPFRRRLFQRHFLELKCMLFA